MSNSKDPSRGNTRDRRRRKLFVLRQFGDGELTTCTFCAVPLDYETLCLDRITPGYLGGTYSYDNIRPSCKPCGDEQGGRYSQLAQSGAEPC